MKRILTTATALTLISAPAFAGGPGEILKTLKKDEPTVATKADGCNLVFPFSLLDEDASGNNCPATGTERFVGNAIALGTAGVVVHYATGGSFPILAGGL